jgi:parallel beta helix pectate lyase-like protein/fibronectin type III domain protein
MSKTLRAVGVALVLSGVVVAGAAGGRSQDRKAPTAPTRVAAQALSATSIRVDWAPSSDNVGVVGYYAYKGRKRVGRTTTTSYDFNGLSCGLTYNLGVAAYDKAGNVSAKTIVAGSTVSCGAPPQNVSAPAIQGEAAVGTELVGSAGDWIGAPTAFTFQWRRCSSLASCVDISAATASSYVVSAADEGSSLALAVTAENAFGRSEAVSAPTASVSLTSPDPQPAPTPWSPLPASTGATYYVSTSGSDTNPGSFEQPWRTVQRAMDTLKPGQRALVRAGVYEQNLVMRRAGTATDPITIENYPGERPVLHPAASSPSYPLRLTTGTAYVRFRGFVIENAVGASIQNVYGAGSNPGAHDYEISGCEIRNARNSSGMFIDNTNHHVYVIGNLVHDNNESGVQHQGIYIEADDSLVANNLVYHHTNGFGIQVRTDASAGPRRIVVTNNTVTDNSLGGILVEHTAIDTTVVNNVSAFNQGAGIRGYYSIEDHASDSIGTGNVAHDNVVYGNAGYGNLYTDVPSIIDFSAGNRVADPLFIDQLARDYHVRATSPALDVALGTFAPGADYDGVARPQGGGPDLGAFER